MLGRTFFLASLCLGSITVANPLANNVATGLPEARAVVVAAAPALDASAAAVRNVNWRRLADRATSAGKEYVATHYPAHAEALATRDLETTLESLAVEAFHWIESYYGLNVGGSSNTSTTVASRSPVDSALLVDRAAEMVKDYMRSDTKTMAARDFLINRRVDSVAAKVKRSLVTRQSSSGGGSLFSQIIDGLVSVTETLFGTNDPGVILSELIDFLAKLT